MRDARTPSCFYYNICYHENLDVEAWLSTSTNARFMADMLHATQFCTQHLVNTG